LNVKHVKAAMLADSHSFYVIMYFPLTSIDTKYELYESVAFHSRIQNGNYVSYALDAEYVVTNLHRQAWFTLSEREIKFCEGDEIKVCPANKAVNYAVTESCILALFLQHDNAKQICRRSISAQMPPTLMERRGSSMLYYFPELHNVIIRCHVSETGLLTTSSWKALEYWVTYSIDTFRQVTFNYMKKYEGRPISKGKPRMI